MTHGMGVGGPLGYETIPRTPPQMREKNYEEWLADLFESKFIDIILKR